MYGRGATRCDSLLHQLWLHPSCNLYPPAFYGSFLVPSTGYAAGPYAVTLPPARPFYPVPSLGGPTVALLPPPSANQSAGVNFSGIDALLGVRHRIDDDFSTHMDHVMAVDRLSTSSRIARTESGCCCCICWRPTSKVKQASNTKSLQTVPACTLYSYSTVGLWPCRTQDVTRPSLVHVSCQRWYRSSPRQVPCWKLMAPIIRFLVSWRWLSRWLSTNMHVIVLTLATCCSTSSATSCWSCCWTCVRECACTFSDTWKQVADMCPTMCPCFHTRTQVRQLVAELVRQHVASVKAPLGVSCSDWGTVWIYLGHWLLEWAVLSRTLAKVAYC